MRLRLPTALRPAVTAASYVDIATGLLGSAAAGHAWLAEHLPRTDGAPAPRPTQALVLRLAEHDDPAQALRNDPGAAALHDSWRERREALARYRQALDRSGPTPHSVLPSLLHMHHNRAVGVGPDAEAVCQRMARAAALSWTLRRGEPVGRAGGEGDMSLLMRAAQLALGEQGDVWSRVEDRRPLPDDITPQQVSTMAPSMRRLLLTDAPSFAPAPSPPSAHG